MNNSLNTYQKEEEDMYGFLKAGGEMGKLIRSFNWSDTSLGPIQTWPPCLKSSINIVLQSSVPMVLVWETDGILIYNDAYSIFAGKRHPQLLGAKVVEGWPEVADFNRNMLSKVLQGEKLTYENQQLTLYRNNVAEEVWMNLLYSPIMNESGKPVGALAIVFETTEAVLAGKRQIEIENDLKQREEHLRALVTATSDVIYVMSPDWSEMGVLDGRVFVPNPGRPMGNWEWLKMNIPPHEHARVKKEIENAIKTKSIFQLEHHVRLANGGIGWTSSRAVPILDKNGEIEKWFGAATDITNRKLIEDELKESEIRFRSLADQSPMIVFIIEPNEQATISYWSKSWLDYTGQTLEQALGRAWDGIVHPDDVQIVLDIYVPAFTNRRPYTIPAIRLKRKDGQYRWHLFKASPRHLPDGTFMGYVGVGIDIHDQQMAFKELELKNKQLIQINNDLDSFIYTASHDLKAPVSNLEGLFTTLLGEIQLSEEVAILKGMIETSFGRFKNTIKDLTEITKVQKGGIEDEEIIDLREVIEDVKEGLREEIKRSSAIIQADLIIPSLKFSKKNLRSIIYNFISNGIKYSSPDRQPLIKISGKQQNEYFELIISDNGLGFSPENKKKIFMMFKRFHDHVEGTGIGLYIVKRIIDNAGGKIEVESELGKGTTFKVFFPNHSKIS